MNLNILVVDDETAILRATKQHLLSAGIGSVTTCSDGREVEGLLKKQKYDLILLDISMPFMSGEEVLEQVHQSDPEISVLVISGNNDIDLAIRCIQNGAHDYLLKPIDPSRLLTSVRNATELSNLNKDQIELRKSFFTNDLIHPEDFEEIITHHQDIFNIMKYIEAISKSDFPVLVLGETGVGKDLFAKAIHLSSHREGQYVEINVNEFDQSLFIDSLFGHAKGSFTGAEENRKGLIEKAENGTLFLDEIGDLEPSQQVKLLRLIQNKEYRPIGSDEVKKTNARIIVATNKSLKASIADGSFRKDLYFRLQTHEIHIPPLRRRKEDIPVLTKYFLSKYAEEYNKEVPTIDNKSLHLIAEQGFDGNVRELQQLVLDLTLTYDNKSDFHQLILNKLKTKSIDFIDSDIDEEDTLKFPSIMPTLKELSQLAIEEALIRSNGKKSIAASLLGITASALSQRLNK